jgi:RimJ/RimL family protein N-acetyltransferase
MVRDQRGGILDPDVVLTGNCISLRPPQASDIDDRQRVGRNAEYVRMCGGDSRRIQPMTRRDAEAWYEQVREAPCAWMIDRGGRCIGHARLDHVNLLDRRARYAVGIFDPEAWSHGYGTETTRLVLRYAFETLGLHRVDLRVLEFNTRAIACYERCGFRREGVERESALVGDVWLDDVIMGILAHEYRALVTAWALPALDAAPGPRQRS